MVTVEQTVQTKDLIKTTAKFQRLFINYLVCIKKYVTVGALHEYEIFILIYIGRSNIIVLSINLHSFINYYLSYKYMADPRFKIILVGDVSVGKTALFWRYTQGQFLANKDTLVTAVDFKMKNITIKEKPVKLYIWDTAGSEKYRSIVSTYFKGCQGVIIVFDLSRQVTFRNAVDFWVPTAQSKTPGAIYLLVGNKSDLDVRVSREEVGKWCKDHNFHYIETSVKLNQNVNQAFEWISSHIYEYDQKPKTESLSLKQTGNKSNQNSQGGGCCH